SYSIEVQSGTRRRRPDWWYHPRAALPYRVMTIAYRQRSAPAACDHHLSSASWSCLSVWRREAGHRFESVYRKTKKSREKKERGEGSQIERSEEKQYVHIL